MKFSLINSKYSQSANQSFQSSTIKENLLNNFEIMPDYSNQETREILSKLGPFEYEENDEYSDLKWKEPIQIHFAIYYGQWKNGERNGRGLQLWKDGSQYEGYWKNDRANGKGRLIHADGDAFIGNWLNDKAEGQGIYIYKNGTYYQGCFFLYYLF